MKLLKKIFKSKIERLKEEHDGYQKSIDKQKAEMLYKNSMLEAKVIKLQDKAFKNRENFDRFEEAVNMKIDKTVKLIKAEAEYASKIGAKYTPSKKQNTNKVGK